MCLGDHGWAVPFKGEQPLFDSWLISGGETRDTGPTFFSSNCCTIILSKAAREANTVVTILKSHIYSYMNFNSDLIPLNHNLNLIFIFYVIFNTDGKTIRSEL